MRGVSLLLADRETLPCLGVPAEFVTLPGVRRSNPLPTIKRWEPGRESSATAVPLHVVMPFSRAYNISALADMLRPEGVTWHPIISDASIEFPDEPWIRPFRMEGPPAGWDPCYYKINAWVERNQESIADTDYYTVLCDDDGLMPGHYRLLREIDAPVIITSLLRGDYSPPARPGCCRHPTAPYIATRANVWRAHVGNGQYTMRGNLFREMRFCNDGNSEVSMLRWLVRRAPSIHIERDVYILFNLLEPGRYDAATVGALVGAHSEYCPHPDDDKSH